MTGVAYLCGRTAMRALRSTLPSFLLTLALGLSGCSLPEAGSVQIIGHGGSGPEGEHPMNTREALEAGLALGIDGVELDVQMTADDVLVAYHPAQLNDLTPCEGKVNAKRWEELRRCPNTAEGERAYPIARLDSLLPALAATFPAADLTLDIKLFAEGDWMTYLDHFSSALKALHEHPDLYGRLIVECQIDEFLGMLRSKAPSLPLYLYANEATEGMIRARSLGCAGLTMDNARITSEQVAAAHAQGLKVTLFGVEGWWDHREALLKGPDRLQTDAPRSLATAKE
jgi:glycerophosphoryl diester phosphodiesterase